MKTIMYAFMLTLALGGCAAGGGFDTQSGMSMSTGLAKTLIDNQCRAELNNRNEWRVVALAMTAQQQRVWEDKICGCATEEATQNLTVNDMAHMLDPSQRDRVIADVTAKTVTACMNRLMK